jgi:phospholipid/cholesterol/gamma-HCH transport system substrate-binding protein
VGQVRGIAVVDNSVAEVSFTVAEDIPLAAGVHARIRYRNLVGQRYLALQEAPGDPRPLRAGGLIPLRQTTPALDLTVLFNGFRPLFAALTPQDVNTLAYEIIQVFQGEGGTVASLLRHTASLTNRLADRDAVIGRVITNLTAVLSTLDERERALDQTIVELQRFVSGLAGDRKAIGDALASIADLTTTTGGLLREARPSLAADIRALDSLSATLNENTAVLEGTLQRLPGRYADLTRVASYGSWLNFYLCDFDGRVGLAGHAPITPATFSSQAARCGGGA